MFRIIYNLHFLVKISAHFINISEILIQNNSTGLLAVLDSAVFCVSAKKLG